MVEFIASSPDELRSGTDMSTISWEALVPSDFQSAGDPTVTYDESFIQYDYGTVDKGSFNRFEGTFEYGVSGSDVSSVNGTVSYFRYFHWVYIGMDVYDGGGYTIKNFSFNVSDFQHLTDTEISTAIFAGADTIIGSFEDDTLLAFAGDDVLKGNGGDDILDGGAGSDIIAGGKGNDIYYVDNARDAVFEFRGDGIDSVRSSISYALVSNVENLTLIGSFNTSATGNDLGNSLTGNNGDNALVGRAGNDKLYGGVGADKLYGGTGADSFLYLSQTHSTMASRDMIYDFSRSDGDKINLSVVDANSERAGNQAFIFIGEKAFSGKNQELRYTNTNGDTYIYGDVDGDKQTDFSIRLDKLIELVKGDFIL